MLPSDRDPKGSPEYPKGISRWLELDYHRRPAPVRRLRGPVALLVLGACAAAMVVVGSLPRGRRAYQSAPVSAAHAAFNDECARCHAESFRTARRLARGDESFRSVRDESCLACHDGPIHQASQRRTPACAECHAEHRGRLALARVDDRHCTACHAHIADHTDPARRDPRHHPARDVVAFSPGGHPEFALWNRPDPKDPGTIRFNHQAHLDPRGVRVPEAAKTEVLTCDSCHRPDAARRFMEPIRFAYHCARCHALRVPVEGDFADATARADAERLRREPVPHPGPGESAATVRALLRDRFLEFAGRHPSAQADRRRPKPSRPIPGRFRPVTEAGRAWAEDQLKTARADLFPVNENLRAADRLLFDGAGGCRYCHPVAGDAARRPDGLPEYRPPNLPARWFAQSTFDHDSHRMLDCQQCHAGANASRETSQALMPRVETCLACHDARKSLARADCVACHAYHDRREDRGPRRAQSIAEFLGAEGHPGE
jgi:hypothetical protein